MKKIERLVIPLFLLLSMVLSGCCHEPKNLQIKSLCTSVDRQVAFDSAQQVLEKMHFVIEKADANVGFISTRPLRAGQFFEFWRSDTVGCYNFEEANLSSITRVVEVTIAPGEAGACLTCVVRTRRLELPQHEANSSTDIPGLFSQANGQSMRLSKDQGPEAHWVDLGPDEQLENRIIQRIQKRITNLKGA